MIVVDGQAGINEVTDVVVWTNISNALRVEEELSLPPTPDERIVTWTSDAETALDDIQCDVPTTFKNSADFSQMVNHEHLWIGGHGSKGFFQHSFLSGKALASCMVAEGTGIPKTINVSGITIQCCYGATDAIGGFGLEGSFAKQIRDVLHESGYAGIEIKAYYGPAISGIAASGKAEPGYSVSQLPDTSVEFQGENWDDLKEVIENKLQGEWKTLKPRLKAKAVGLATSQFYQKLKDVNQGIVNDVQTNTLHC